MAYFKKDVHEKTYLDIVSSCGGTYSISSWIPDIWTNIRPNIRQCIQPDTGYPDKYPNVLFRQLRVMIKYLSLPDSDAKDTHHVLRNHLQDMGQGQVGNVAVIILNKILFYERYMALPLKTVLNLS